MRKFEPGTNAHLVPVPIDTGAGARIFLNLFQNFTGVILSLICYMPVDSETLVVTSSISRICRLSLSEVHIGLVLRACIHTGECGCVCERLRLYCVSKNKLISC